MDPNLESAESLSRIPVLDSDASVPVDTLDHQWRLLTEAVRRDTLSLPATRQSLVRFCTEPVSETLPHDLINVLTAVDPRIARLSRRFQGDLGKYLDLPAVPDDQIMPDLLHAQSRNMHKSWDDLYEKMNQEEPELYASMRSVHISSQNGITIQERELVTKRYQYARDIKLLALGAEILEQDGVTPNESGEIILPSGIRMLLHSSSESARADLLTPHLWERRRQLKDRVYEIHAGGRRYILKEKKTARHTDTKKGGHVDGASSEEEYVIACEFQEKGNIQEGSVSVIWEKPLGSVTYPDGFQFALFAFEEGLLDSGDELNAISQYINDTRHRFNEEYIRIRSLIQPDTNISFEDYARVKAVQLHQSALSLLRESKRRVGYINADIDRPSFRIRTDSPVVLEAVGYDFEYYKKVPAEKLDDLRKSHEDDSVNLHEGLGFMEWSDGARVTEQQETAYLAMQKNVGTSSETI